MSQILDKRNDAGFGLRESVTKNSNAFSIGFYIFNQEQNIYNHIIINYC